MKRQDDKTTMGTNLRHVFCVDVLGVSTHVPEKAWVQENIFVNAQATQTHNTLLEAQDWKPNYKDLNGKLL